MKPPKIDILPDRREALRDGEALSLGARAFDVLAFLSERQGEVVSKGEIFERVGKIGKTRGPLVGPTTLFAWGVPLLFVITISVAPATILNAMADVPADTSEQLEHETTSPDE